MVRKLLIAALALAAVAADAAPRYRVTTSVPKKFPDVPLLANSRPRFAVLGVNPWTNAAAFVMFDGDLSNGYKRIYVWIPDDPDYDKPVALNANESRRFDPFTVSATNGENGATLSWALAWSTNTTGGGGGTRTEVDYVTGKSRTVTVAAQPISRHAAFGYSLTYRYGPADSVLASGSKAPLELVLSSSIGAYGSWSNVTGAAHAPWNQIQLAMAPKYFPDKAGLKVNLTGQLTHGGGSCRIVSLPPESQLTVIVSPYLDPPVYSNTLPGVEGMRNTEIFIPYGWHSMWYALRAPGIRSAGGATGLTPYSRPLPADRTSSR